MRLAVLAESENHVCCRYRAAAFRLAFEQAGHSLSIFSYAGSFVSRLQLFRRLRDFDAVILLRKLFSPLELFVLRRSVKKLIFDLDDAVWLRDSYAPKGFHDPRRLARFRATLASVDLVVAGNSFLADESRRMGAREVTCIPTCVDLDRYPTSKHLGDPPRLVWVGSSSTLQALERNRPIWESLGRAIPGLRLRMICDQFCDFSPLIVEKIPWSEATETERIAESDIGIACMPDDPWSRGKCGLKLLQYMAAGLPAIADPVGVHSEIIRDGTGFLARNPDDWITAVQQLSQPETRRQMGILARQRVERDYSVATGAKLWLQALQTLQNSQGTGR